MNGSGRSAAASDAAGLRSRGLATLPRRGPLSITVPGAVRSWGDAHARFGRLSRDEVLAPAVELARAGFPASDGFIGAVETTFPIVARELGPDAGFAAVYRPHGRPWRPGERVRLPALADTLETLVRDGFDAFYDGDLGERQARALAAAGSPIRVDDLREHTSTWGEPIAIDYRGVRVTTHPPNSSGVVALELLGLLERFEPPNAGSFGPEGVTDSRWIHLSLEAAKLAMADRDAYLTDPAVRDVPVEMLLDRERLAALAAKIEPTRAGAPAAATNPRGGGTIFLATVDADGNAVSLIESNYMGFGSGVVDPATGVHYQNRGSYFSLEPDHPNVLEPRKRTLHTLLPGMLFRDGQAGPWIVAGAMGGDAQPQVHAQFVQRRRRWPARHPHGDRRATLLHRTGRSLRATDQRVPRTATRRRHRRARCARLGTSWRRRRRSTRTSGTNTPSSSSTAVPEPPTGRSRRPRIRAARAFPPSGRPCHTRFPVAASAHTTRHRTPLAG